jgi:hypothetical protein
MRGRHAIDRHEAQTENSKTPPEVVQGGCLCALVVSLGCRQRDVELGYMEPVHVHSRSVAHVTVCVHLCSGTVFSISP